MKRLIWEGPFCSHWIVNFSGMQLKGERRTYAFFCCFVRCWKRLSWGRVDEFFLSSSVVFWVWISFYLSCLIFLRLSESVGVFPCFWKSQLSVFQYCFVTFFQIFLNPESVLCHLTRFSPYHRTFSSVFSFYLNRFSSGLFLLIYFLFQRFSLHLYLISFCMYHWVLHFSFPKVLSGTLANLLGNFLQLPFFCIYFQFIFSCL